MVAAWDTRGRYLASTLSQAANIKELEAESFYELCLLQAEFCFAALLCASQGYVQLLRLENAAWIGWYDNSDCA